MLFDDLKYISGRAGGKKLSPEVEAEIKQGIINKYKAEMVYYHVIEKVFNVYMAGDEHVQTDQNKLSDIRFDVLCCVRDQMAKFASDNNILDYYTDDDYKRLGIAKLGLDNLVKDFDYKALIANSIRYSESLVEAIKTQLCTDKAFDPNVTEDMDDSQINAMTEQEIDEILDFDDPESLGYQILKICEKLDDTSEFTDNGDRNKFGDPDDTNAYVVSMYNQNFDFIDEQGHIEVKNDSYVSLKISPFIPYLYANRLLGTESLGFAPYYDGNEGVCSCEILEYDSKFGVLQPVSKDITTIGKSKNAVNGAVLRDLYSRCYLYMPDFDMLNKSYIERRKRYLTDEAMDKNNADLVEGVDVAYSEQEYSYRQLADDTQSLVFYFKSRMASILNKYSVRELSEEDIEVIDSMFTPDSFGELVKNGSDKEYVNSYRQIMKTSDEYFDYIEHVCETMRNTMSSHEFEVHLHNNQWITGTVDESETSDKVRANVLYFTGEHTDDYNTARKNDSRFLGVYVDVNYFYRSKKYNRQSNMIKNLNNQPIFGDVITGNPNSNFVITDKSIRTMDNFNQYGLGTITSEKVAHAKKLFDSVIDNNNGKRNSYKKMNSKQVNENLVIRKYNKKIFNTAYTDISQFINNDGSIAVVALKQALINDRDAIISRHSARYVGEDVYSTLMMAVNNMFSNKPLDDDSHNDVADNFAEYVSTKLNILYQNEGVKTGLSMDAFFRQYFENHDAVEFFMKELRYKDTKDTKAYHDDTISSRGLRKDFDNAISEILKVRFGDEVDSFIVAKYVYKSYFENFIKDVINSYVTDDNLLKISDTDNIEENLFNLGLNDDAVDQIIISNNVRNAFSDLKIYENADNVIHEVITNQEAADNPYLKDAMQDLFGKGNVIKVNMCKRYSDTFAYYDYEDILRLLSYTQGYEYVSDPTIVLKGDEYPSDKIVLQLFSSDYSFNSDNTADDDVQSANRSDDNLNELDDEQSGDAGSSNSSTILFDDEMFYNSIFATLNFEKDTSFSDIDDVKTNDMGKYRALHPLTYASLNIMNNSLSQMFDDYDPKYLKITPNGIAYYAVPTRSGDYDVKIKLGPIIEEKGYIRPFIQSDGTVINTPVYDDKHRLRNQVIFGGLDTSALITSRNVVPNRIYGLSANVDSWDGFDHNGEFYTDRMHFDSYQTNILANISKNMNLFAMTHHSDDYDRTATAKAYSIFYTNIGTNTLQKSYRSNTYLIADKVNFANVDYYLDHYMDKDPDAKYGMINFDGLSDAEVSAVKSKMDNIVNYVVFQMRINRERVVFPKIVLNDNIGLFNTVLNMSLCTNSKLVGNINRKSMLDTDCLSARVAMFHQNDILDDSLSGTAKQLGAIGFLSMAANVNRLSGKLTLDENAPKRSRLIADGIRDFSTNELTAMFNNFVGAKAIDREQLSNNAIEKGLNYAHNIKFAMISLGDNMEDGQILSSRVAASFGHFEKDESSDNKYVYKYAIVGDKMGDGESGNKGVMTKIVNVDIQTDEEFKENFANQYFSTFWFNYEDNKYEMYQNFKSILTDYVNSQEFKNILLTEYNSDPSISAISSNEFSNFGDFEKYIKDAYKNDSQSLSAVYKLIGDYCISNQIEPYVGEFKHNFREWQIFHDNPDLDLVVNNVCVDTRSNPSLLMYLKENRENDWEDSQLKIRSDVLGDDSDDNMTVYNGACGRGIYYVDSHTANDKNKDYTSSSSKSGRRYGAQEFYALRAKNCTSDFLDFTLSNDPIIANNFIKLNNKIMMHGMYIDFDDDFKVKFLVDKIDEFSDTELKKTVSITGEDCAYTSDAMPGYSFIDVDKYSDIMIENMFKLRDVSLYKRSYSPENMVFNDGDYNYISDMLKRFSNMDFSNLTRFNTDENANVGTAGTEYIRRFFDVNFGLNGGNFIMLPECIDILNANVPKSDSKQNDTYESYHRTTNIDYGDDVDAYDIEMFGGEGVDTFSNVDTTPKQSIKGVVNVEGLGERSVIPLFLSSRVIVDSDDQVVKSNIDDKMQFDIYQSILAASFIDKINDMVKKSDMSDDNKRMINNSCTDYLTNIRKHIESRYMHVSDNKSLNIDDISSWVKKNIYGVVFPKSATAVWCGRSDMASDEVGMSVAMAARLGFIKPKNGVNIPDKVTADKLSEYYDWDNPQHIAAINRSPGQTTGCIRAYRIRIDDSLGDCIAINPGCATIHDGDFDGDTVGVINPFYVSDEYKKRIIESYKTDNESADTVDYKKDARKYIYESVKAAVKEFDDTMSMAGNMVQTADYTEISKGDKTISLHPLFIACNADLGVGLYNDKKNGGNLGDQLDQIMVKANMLECFKKIISAPSDGEDIRDAYKEQFNNLTDFCDDEKFIKDVSGSLNDYYSGKKYTSPAQYEHKLYSDFMGCYKKIWSASYDEIRVNHGNTDLELINNIINDTSICKKGKLPQLNALLQFSGTHVDCKSKEDAVYGLSVKKTDNGFRLFAGDSEVNSLSKNELEELSQNVSMDNKKAKSDVLPSRFKSPTQSNITGQADKSDATGLGGSLAQKLQKIFDPFGFSELGLRISGPITQQFLDAKQNVQKCTMNLKIGKFCLSPISQMKRVGNFADGIYDKAKSHLILMSRYWFDVKDPMGKYDQKPLSVAEAVTQTNNLTSAMGLPELSKYDSAEMMYTLDKYAEEPKQKKQRGHSKVDKTPVINNIISKSDAAYNFLWAIMYGNNGKSRELLMGCCDKNNQRSLAKYAIMHNMTHKDCTQDVLKTNFEHDEESKNKLIDTHNSKVVNAMCENTKQKEQLKRDSASRTSKSMDELHDKVVTLRGGTNKKDILKSKAEDGDTNDTPSGGDDVGFGIM